MTFYFSGWGALVGAPTVGAIVPAAKRGIADTRNPIPVDSVYGGRLAGVVVSGTSGVKVVCTALPVAQAWCFLCRSTV